MFCISYEIFLKLIEESREYEDSEMYIAERAWQKWMDPFEGNPELITKILDIIFRMGKSNIQDERKIIGILSRAEMSRKYRIPLRTLENWELNENNIADYTMNLILYTFFLQILNKEDAEND